MSERVCDSCSQWNDWIGKCDTPYWCPDKESVNQDYYREEDEEENE